jgi:hypothetical protein
MQSPLQGRQGASAQEPPSDPNQQHGQAALPESIRRFGHSREDSSSRRKLRQQITLALPTANNPSRANPAAYR